MRDLFKIAHGFFCKNFLAGLAGAGRWRFIAPQGAQKKAAGHFARQPLLRLRYCAAALLHSGTDHLVIWKERVMGAA